MTFMLLQSNGASGVFVCVALNLNHMVFSLTAQSVRGFASSFSTPPSVMEVVQEMSCRVEATFAIKHRRPN